LGGLVVFVLSVVGVPFYRPGVEGVTTIIRPEIDFEIFVLAFLFSVGAALLASIYPANRGSKMNPVEALRSV